MLFQDYQFWTQTDEHGNFYIKAVLPGTYNLHAWVPGIMGNYMYEAIVTITPGIQPPTETILVLVYILTDYQTN